MEILDSSIREKWYVRTVGGPVLAHGWVPSDILEHVPDEDEPDFGGKKSAKGYVPITTGKDDLRLSCTVVIVAEYLSTRLQLCE